MKKLVLTGLLIAAPAVAFAEGEPATPAEGEAATPPVETTGEATPPAADPAMGEPMKKMTVGADLAFVLPLGDYADGASAAFGALGRFEFAATPAISVTARLGFVYNLLKDVPEGVSASLIFIPIMVGGTYKIGTSGLFAHAEVGFTNIRASAEAGGMEFSSSETKLAVGAGVGYQMNKLKFRGGFYMPGSSEDDDGMGGTTTTTLFGILVSAGYDFASF